MENSNNEQVLQAVKSLAEYTELLNKRCDDLERKISGKNNSFSEELFVDVKKANDLIIHALEPIKPLLKDPSVNDILINSHNSIFIESNGKLLETDLSFESEEKLLEVVNIIASSVGRTLDKERPFLDARLPDGSRVNIITPPLTLDGIALSIRKFSSKLITLDDMVKNEVMSQEMADFLKICARSKINILIVGGTGVGKTTLLNAIAQHIGETERVVTIEDSAELKLPIKHVVRMEAKQRTPGKENTEVSIRDLVSNSLRMRPDRVIIGEVRGHEAFDMIQAINTGHDGSMTSIHANSPREALLRLESMITLAATALPSFAIKQRISSSFEVMVMIGKTDDNCRKINNITEIVGMESETIMLQNLFKYTHKGNAEDGKTHGEFINSRIIPRVAAKAKLVGLYDEMAALFNVSKPIPSKNS